MRSHFQTLWTDAQTLSHSQRSYPKADCRLLIDAVISLCEMADPVHQVMQKVGKSFDPVEGLCERHCAVHAANI